MSEFPSRSPLNHRGPGSVWKLQLRQHQQNQHYLALGFEVQRLLKPFHVGSAELQAPRPEEKYLLSSADADSCGLGFNFSVGRDGYKMQ